MSDTESFESAYERLYPQLHNPCGLWKAATIAEWLDDLERAHDREIAQARDPQRLRGTKPDTFDGAIEALREFRWQHATNDEDAIPYINAVKEMHDREIRDVSQREYDRGFHAGQHSMDAKHRAIAMRLRGLRFDSGSHENLSRIAYAIYPCATGWTCESADGLRDKLVDLMGGVSDDTCGAGCCCAAADCDGDCGLQREEVEHGRAAHDCGADTCCGGCGGDLHMDGLVAYDVLWNERRRVIAKLRKIPDVPDSSYTYDEHLAMIYDALDVDAAPLSYSDLDEIRDRLIHLLGGDQPSGIDMLRAMDDDGTCPNDDITSPITDELRKWADSDVWSCKWEEFKVIADRIDAQFDRICEQQEAVLQSTIDGMVKEYEHDRESDQLRIEKLVRQRDAAYACADELSDELLRVRRERDEARDECDRLKRDMLDEWVPRTSYEEKVEKYRRAYMESDAWRKSLQEKLNAMRDAITAALNG